MDPEVLSHQTPTERCFLSVVIKLDNQVKALMTVLSWSMTGHLGESPLYKVES